MRKLTAENYRTGGWDRDLINDILDDAGVHAKDVQSIDWDEETRKYTLHMFDRNANGGLQFYTNRGVTTTRLKTQEGELP
jgi:hypothetical protein